MKLFASQNVGITLALCAGAALFVLPGQAAPTSEVEQSGISAPVTGDVALDKAIENIRLDRGVVDNSRNQRPFRSFKRATDKILILGGSAAIPM